VCLTKPVKQSELMDAILTASGAPAPAAAVPAASPHGQPRRALRILVAEDNATNQRLVVALLAQWGHAVTVANDGREAVALSGQSDFDVILMDVQMPEMNGLDATAAIRERERGGAGHVPIIAMTAHAMAGDRDQCLEAGMDAYVSKPLRAADLFDTLERTSVSLAGDAGAALPPVSPAATTRDAFDAETLIANFGGSRQLVAEVIDVFLTDSDAMTAAIRHAIESRDHGVAGSAAHALKGSIGLFSRGRSFELARQIELSARAGDLSHANEEVAELEGAVASLTRELRTLRETLRRSAPPMS
jgi:CheY-like chemotaxis protein